MILYDMTQQILFCHVSVLHISSFMSVQTLYNDTIDNIRTYETPLYMTLYVVWEVKHQISPKYAKQES